MAAHREITGTFIRESHVFESDDGVTRTIIGELQVRQPSGAVPGDGQPDYYVDTVRIKGEAAEGELVPGLAYRLYGRTADHWKHGPQFQFDSFVVDQPAGERAVRIYLEQCDGIGPKKAAAIWAEYGNESIEMLRTRPIDVATQVKILKIEKAIAAAEYLRGWQSIEKAKLDCLALLHGRGLPKKTVENAIKKYGSAAASILRRNPYHLIGFRGIGFSKADKLYTEFGHNPARLKRQTLCAWHAVASNSSGDTWFKNDVCGDAIRQNVAGARIDFDRAMQLALRSGILVKRTDSDGGRWFAERRKADSESRIARYVAEALCEPSHWRQQIGDLGSSEISDHQRSQLLLAIDSAIGVLAGSPGTGKTFTSAALIRALIAVVGESLVAVCAPTGKAAVRLSEALQRNGVSLRAVTIHSLLGVMSNNDGWEFQYNERRPLPYSFIIVDESSMIDTDLMASLLAARALGTFILFVGDPNQLSPVGHGAPLRDFVTAGIPTGTLTEIERQDGASRIVKACAQIREKKQFQCSDEISLPLENLKLIPAADAAKAVETLSQVMRAIQANKQFDPIWDVQILVAVNKKSLLGRKPLNVALQSLLNPTGQGCDGSPFRVGDKIICTKNGWLPAAARFGVEQEGQKDGKLYVANGEQAEVVKVEPRRTVARLTAPDRVVVIPRGETREGGGEDGGGDDESTGTGCNWELGYAISCHKSQGSEWPVVIVMLDEYPGARQVCSRQWTYTAISRAKTLCLMIGKKQTADDTIYRDALFKRKTFLVETIRSLTSPRKPEVTFDLNLVLAAV